MSTDRERQVLRNVYTWQDADTMLAGLEIRPGDTCLSVDAAGDNALAMLARDPKRVLVVEPNRSQIACLELRLAAFRRLDHGEMLTLLGVRPGLNRAELYHRCRPQLSRLSRIWWDAHLDALCQGLHTLGIWERFFTFFRRHIIPLLHHPRSIERLFMPRDAAGRAAFFDQEWDGWMRRLILRLFFSRHSIQLFDPDRHFLGNGIVNLAGYVLERTHHGMAVQDPSRNPYLRWILTGSFEQALPFALRPENFACIRDNLDRLEWRCAHLGDVIQELGLGAVDRIDMGIQVEHLHPAAYHAQLDRLMRACRRGGRIIHWNLLVPRARPPEIDARLIPQSDLSRRLHERDHGFYHHSVVVEEIA